MWASNLIDELIFHAPGRVTPQTDPAVDCFAINPAVDSLFLCAVRSCRGERKAQGDYTARPFDPDAQLQNNLNRWYDARVGRWLSEDPVGFAAGDGNLYRYVANETLWISDPSGKNPSDALWKYWNNGRLPKAWAFDITGSAVLGTGFAGVLQIVFLGDTCEFGLFAIGPAAANPTKPMVDNPVELLKHATKRFFLEPFPKLHFLKKFGTPPLGVPVGEPGCLRRL